MREFWQRSPGRALAVIDHDPHDQWGWVMGQLFAIAETLTRLGHHVPDELEYQPSPFIKTGEPPDDDDFLVQWWWDSLTGFNHDMGRPTVTVADAQRTARVLNRYAALLDRAGCSY